MKRVFDIIISLIGCMLLIPIMLIIKIIYVVNKDYNKIIYVQERVGLNGKIFKLYKFRTMVIDSDIRLKELLKINKYFKEWEKYQKLEDDPRVTKIGKILRDTCIDELPQFFNVLKGDMSLVGPRPLVLGELELHGGDLIYQSVKPGITGYWASLGGIRNYKKRLEEEYYYINNYSIKMDIICIIKTIKLLILKCKK